jgi:hypothetical protein
MPANTNPVFTLTPIIGMAQCSTNNANLDGTGTLATVVTGATNGTRIDRVTVEAITATVASMVRFFIYDGSNTRLFAELPVTAIAPSATVVAFTGTLVFDRGLVLPYNWSLKASCNFGSGTPTFNVFAIGGDF